MPGSTELRVTLYVKRGCNRCRLVVPTFKMVLKTYDAQIQIDMVEILGKETGGDPTIMVFPTIALTTGSGLCRRIARKIGGRPISALLGASVIAKQLPAWMEATLKEVRQSLLQSGFGPLQLSLPPAQDSEANQTKRFRPAVVLQAP